MVSLREIPERSQSCQVLTFAVLLAWALLHLSVPPATGAEKKDPATPSPWGDWIEADFPFFSSILDARQMGDVSPKTNLTPRGLILNLGHGVWAGFDTDLLRIAAIWDGRSVTPQQQAHKTYHSPFRGPRGTGEYPAPDGTVWLANDTYPGWQLGETFSSVDPREPQPSPEEVGRGPLAAELGRFRELRLTKDGVRLECTVGTSRIHEWIRARRNGESRIVERRVRVFPAPHPILLVVARRSTGAANPLFVKLVGGAPTQLVHLREEAETWTVAVAPHSEPVDFVVAMSTDSNWPASEVDLAVADGDRPAPARWREPVVTQGVLSAKRDPYVVDSIPLPLENPWHRNVRLGDIQFFTSGRAAAVTHDGDVWLIDGLGGSLDAVSWRRFASGLHEPISLTIRDERIFVFDRNGIWCLQDTNGDGEADVYQMFSNNFTQTVDQSDLPNSIKTAPDGSFVIAKGGQRRRTYSRDSGTTLRISADGGSTTVLGHGFRQPFATVHPRTGMVTVTDQDGHHVPATPIYVLDRDRNHGYPTRETLTQIYAKFHLPPTYPEDLADPVVWMPRSVNSAAVSQVWLVDARMGPLNDTLIHIGYNRPELLVVQLSDRTPRRQAVVMSLTRDLQFSPLSGSVNPRDGQLYVAGFVLNNSAKISEGLARVRFTGLPYSMPREVVAMDKGFLLRFDIPLDREQAVNPDNYTIARWNYRRTPNYGSPPYRLDGTMGREPMTPSSAYVSQDGKNVFVGVGNMQPAVMQTQIGWTLASRDGVPSRGEATLSPIELARFEPHRDGFGDLTVDLTPPTRLRSELVEPISAADGGRLARSMGCYGCHTTDGTKGIGPTWKGLAGSMRTLKDGEQVVADEAYLRESILFPAAKMVDGYDQGMPGYAGIMGDSQLESLILYIKSLSSPPTVSKP